MRSRRVFLQRASGALIGILGFFVPQKIWACHRGRRRSAECAVQTTPVLAGNFPIEYPDGKSPVPGNGGFYAWGTTTSRDITANTAEVTTPSGQKIRVATFLGPSACAMGGNAWGARFDAVNNEFGTGFSLKVSGTYTGGVAATSTLSPPFTVQPG